MARIRQRLRGWRGLLADAWLLPRALVIWNVRKTLYRVRGTKTRCPCQHPSDSGRAFETHCDAAADWSGSGRFRIVCPLVRTTADGFVCSVDARDVRPFWGRAFALFAGALFASYLGWATLELAIARTRGINEVAWLDFAWPGRWENVPKARARYFCARGIAALESRDPALALISLETAVTLDPRNYDAAVLLAMLHTLSADPGAGDAAFQWLLDRHPAQALRSAILYHDLLLGSGRIDRLAPFALWMARHDIVNATVWVRALLLGLRVTGDAAAFAKRNAAELAHLDPSARALIAIEILLQQNQLAPAHTVLQRLPAPGTPPIFWLIQLEQLLRLRETAGATVVKQAASAILGPFRTLALQYLIEQRADNPAFARACFAKLLDGELGESEVDWLAAVLVRAPDREAFAQLDRRLRAKLPAGAPGALGGALWTAALTCGDTAAADYWAKFLRERAHLETPAPGEIEFTSLALNAPRTVPALLTRLPLPRETGYALYARVQVARR